ncbi:MAG: hypothetical protein AAFR76_03720 [Planctomycetota bacterium]
MSFRLWPPSGDVIGVCLGVLMWLVFAVVLSRRAVDFLAMPLRVRAGTASLWLVELKATENGGRWKITGLPASTSKRVVLARVASVRGAGPRVRSFMLSREVARPRLWLIRHGVRIAEPECQINDDSDDPWLVHREASGEPLSILTTLDGHRHTRVPTAWRVVIYCTGPVPKPALLSVEIADSVSSEELSRRL